MSVVLMDYSCKDTISILKFLLALAVKGKLRGLALQYRDDSGHEASAFTGLYKEHQQYRFNAGHILDGARTVDPR